MIMEPKKNPLHDVHRYSKTFFLIGLSISICLAITAFEWTTEKKKQIIDPPSPFADATFVLYPPVVLPEAPKPTPVQRTQPIDVVQVTEVDNSTKQAEQVEPEPASEEGPIVLVTDLPKEDSVEIFIFVEQMPKPVGGYEEFYKQVQKNLKYPAVARRTGTEGKVHVEFVINENGDPINLKVTKAIGKGCDEEAMRVISKIKWEPGKQRGRPVLVRMTLPLYFKLN
jgi:periplasmic protein TonB